VSERTREIRVRSTRHRELQDVTAQVRTATRELAQAVGVSDGLCSVYVPHTTAGLTINENADPDVAADLLLWATDLLGDENRFKHWERNTGGHIFSSLFGCSLTVPLAGGDLALGQWQAIYLVEGDGPRERTLRVTVL
jgi:secondary thiamine-phosphate synthase enzyme